MTSKWDPHMTEHLDPLRIANEKIDELMRMVAYERGERERLAAEVESYAPKPSDLNDDLLALEERLVDALLDAEGFRRDRDELAEVLRAIHDGMHPRTWDCWQPESCEEARAAGDRGWCPACVMNDAWVRLHIYMFGEVPTPPEVQDMVRDAINGEGEFS